MKTKIYIFLLGTLLSLALISSCRKSPFEQNLNEYSNDKAASINISSKEIFTWIDKHGTTGINSNLSKLNLLKKNLKISEAWTEKRDNGDNLLIIPIDDQIKIEGNINEKSILNLLIVQNSSGKLKWTNIISFFPTSGKVDKKLSSNTIQHILNNQPVEDDGIFKFLSLTGKLQYQLKYKNKELVSWGRVKTKDNHSSVKINSSSHCVDWYLVEIDYYSDGSTHETWTYLYTTCDGDSDGGGGGGGGGGGDTPSDPTPDPDDPNDQEISKTVSFSSGESQLGEDDMAINPGGETGEVDADGNTTGPLFKNIQYEYRVTIAYGVQTGLVISAYQHEVVAFPVNETYISPSGQTVTRNVLPHSVPLIPPFSGSSVYCHWICSVDIRTTKNPGGITNTRTYNRDLQHVVTVP